MNKFPILFLSRSDIQPLVGMSDILTYVEEAFSLYSKSESGANIAHFSPMVSFPTKIPNTDMDYRAGLMDPIPAACSTLGFGYWDNPVNYNMPSVFAFSYLSDVKHAKPLAFMECYYLGGMRTGAAGGVASKYVAKKNPKSLAFIGVGSVAKYTLSAHVELYGKIDNVKAWSRTADKRNDFVNFAKKTFDINVTAVDNPKEAVENVDIVCCSTPSREPIVMRDWISPGTHINAFGADGHGKQELDHDLIANSKIVVDSLNQCKIGGEIELPIKNGLITDSDVHASLGDIINGDKIGRENDDEVTIMDSTGLNAQDIVCCYRTYEKAVAKGVGTTINSM